jgi:hypothetical protein
MPPNTVSVTRPGRYGNLWTPEKYWEAGYRGSLEVAIEHCVEAYRAWLEGRDHWAHGIPLPPVPDLAPLRGKNLACWCKEGARWCHADVLLDLANQPRPKTAGAAVDESGGQV